MPIEQSRAMHANDWVEVRSKQEILETLDKNGRLDGMPFMPQMFEYCGKRFKVHKSAHKACDPVYTMASRGVDDAVHLNLRCNGQAYGGCQAGCRLFWKEAWLKPVDPEHPTERAPARQERRPATVAAPRKTCGGARGATAGSASPTPTRILSARTRSSRSSPKPLSWWNPTQYVKDYVSGNVTLGEMVRGAIYVLFGRRFGRRIPLLRRAYNAFQKLTGGHAHPGRQRKDTARPASAGRKPQSPARRSRARQIARGDPRHAQ